MNKLRKDDIERLIEKKLFIDSFSGKTILLTGVTGLVGGYLLHYFFELSKTIQLNIICIVRDIAKVDEDFKKTSIKWINSDVIEPLKLVDKIDYIIHCASPTESKFFVTNPVDTINTIYNGTFNLLKLAVEKNVLSFVYLSSIEAYGVNSDKSLLIDETFYGFIDPINTRSSYPMSKRFCELLCLSFYKQMNVSVRIARLTSVISPFEESDNRFFAQLTKQIKKDEPITLLTSGESSKSCIYIADAISAILFLLISGKKGEIYNVASPNSCRSIKQISTNMTRQYLNKDIRIQLTEKTFYPPESHYNLSVSKLLSLGWIPDYTTEEALTRVIDNYLKD